MPKNGKLVRISLVPAAAARRGRAVITAGAASAKKPGSVNGAGSTFVAPLVAKWERPVKSALEIPLNYSAGRLRRRRLTPSRNKQVDFGASDAPLSQFSPTCNDCVQIPWALAATAMMYRVDGVQNLKMTGPVLAKIYLGQIK